MKWKINDISLYIKHKLQYQNSNNNDENEEKIDYEKLENVLQNANIEKNSVYDVNKSLQKSHQYTCILHQNISLFEVK